MYEQINYFIRNWAAIYSNSFIHSYQMWGGELYIPKIPSYRLADLAKAIAPEVKHEIVGMRPGEKLHEEMITETDALNTIEFDDYFVVLPATSLWDTEKFRKESNSSIGKKCELGFSYNSYSNEQFLSVDRLIELIKDEM